MRILPGGVPAGDARPRDSGVTRARGNVVSLNLAVPAGADWLDPAGYWQRLDTATGALDPPFGVLSLEALAWNAHAILERASGTPVRVASKSLRVRSVLDAVLALPGYAGVLAYTLPEALWLAESIDDVVVGYPTTHLAGVATLARSPELAARITLMVDSVEQLDVVDSVLPPSARERIRVCIELDVSLPSRVFGHVGAWRSPVDSAERAGRLAEAIAGRRGFTLVGLMAYESQVAGLVDDAQGRRIRSGLVRWAKRASLPRIAERRAAAAARVGEVAELEFVNGGGTGSIESTVADPAVTEVAAGSGLFGPHLFDRYRAFQPAPAASFALPVVRKPRADVATVLGGGWIASGMSGADRSPHPVWPAGLRLTRDEGAGEVQTPLVGPGARALRIGDRVWLRHTKAGELSEHLDGYAVVAGGSVVDTAVTYRGEGRAFL